MKEFEITELMRDYTDDEFNIEGENAADTDKVMQSVMMQVKPKKKVRPMFKALIAAAAAVVLAGTVTAATIAIKGGYTTLTGIDVVYEADELFTSWSMSYGLDNVPIRLEEDGRLMFVADGQSIDITDLVDENTPYIYSYDNSEGDTCYIAVGGAAGDYGYLELFPVKLFGDEVKWNEIGYNTSVPEDQWLPYPENLTGGSGDEEADEQQWEEHEKAVREAMRSQFKPWCLAVFDGLDIWDSIGTTGELSTVPDDFKYSFGVEAVETVGE